MIDTIEKIQKMMAQDITKRQLHYPFIVLSPFIGLKILAPTFFISLHLTKDNTFDILLDLHEMGYETLKKRNLSTFLNSVNMDRENISNSLAHLSEENKLFWQITNNILKIGIFATFDPFVTLTQRILKTNMQSFLESKLAQKLQSFTKAKINNNLTNNCCIPNKDLKNMVKLAKYFQYLLNQKQKFPNIFFGNKNSHIKIILHIFNGLNLSKKIQVFSSISETYEIENSHTKSLKNMYRKQIQQKPLQLIFLPEITGKIAAICHWVYYQIVNSKIIKIIFQFLSSEREIYVTYGDAQKSSLNKSFFIIGPKSSSLPINFKNSYQKIFFNLIKKEVLKFVWNNNIDIAIEEIIIRIFYRTWGVFTLEEISNAVRARLLYLQHEKITIDKLVDLF